MSLHLNNMPRFAAGVVLAMCCTTVFAQTQAAAPAPAGAAAPAAVAPTLQKIRNTGVITLAHREGSVPFSYFDANKKPVGYALDLCMKVVDALRKEMKMPNLRVDYLAVSAAQRIPSILEGKADLECGNTTNTAARRKQVAFTVTHYFAGGRLLVRKGAKLNEISDLRGQAVAVNKGSTHATNLSERINKGLIAAKLVEAKDATEAFTLLEEGKVDAYLHDDIVLFSLRANSKTPERYEVVGNFVSVEPLAIMLRKGDPEFKKFVDTTLSRFMIDGELRPLYNRWFLSAIPPNNANLNIPMSPLLRDQMRFPTDKVGDDVDG